MNEVDKLKFSHLVLACSNLVAFMQYQKGKKKKNKHSLSFGISHNQGDFSTNQCMYLLVYIIRKDTLP